MRCLIKIRRC